MATSLPAAGIAKLILISDFPVDAKLLSAVRPLWGDGTSEADLVFGVNGKWCEWPCRAPYECSEVDDPGFNIYLCASFLWQRRKVVERIRQLGCNLELCLYVQALPSYFSLAAATMKQLGDLEIQLSFCRPSR